MNRAIQGGERTILAAAAVCGGILLAGLVLLAEVLL